MIPPSLIFYPGLAVIRWQSRGPYGHVAFRRPNGNVVEAQLRAGVVEREYVAGDGGVEFVLKDRITSAQAEMMDIFAMQQVGKPYDLLGVLRFISRTPERRWQDSWFCSELVMACFQAGCVDLLERIQPWAVDPNKLAVSPLIRPSAMTIAGAKLALSFDKDSRVHKFHREISGAQ